MALLLTTSAVTRVIDPLDYPRCDKCDMPVEQFCVVDTHNAITLVAACHGKEQIISVPDELWSSMIGSHVKLGPVFTEDSNE